MGHPLSSSLVLVAVLIVEPRILLAVDRFVSTAGVDTGGCTSSASPCRTVTYAATQAANLDVIKVAAGNYVEHVVIDGSTDITVSGGWSADFSGRDPVITPTQVRAERQPSGFTSSVFEIAASAGEAIEVTLDGLRLVTADAGVAAFAEADGQANLSVTGCDLSRNRTAITATTVDTAVANVAINASTFTRNAQKRYVFSSGAAVNANAYEDSAIGIQLSGSLFDLNRNSGGFGFAGAVGAFANQNATITLDVAGCSFSRNRGNHVESGGAVMANGPTGALTVNVADSVFNRNKDADGAGALSVAGADLTITNSAFVQNRSRVGFGALQVTDSTATLTNVTVYGNGASGVPGVGVSGGAGLTLRNSILWDTGTPAIANVGGTIDADHNDIESGTYNDLGGNISADPLLDVDGIHLLAGSPCIDVGTCAGAPATDIDGDTRPTGSGCDIGADERTP